MELLKLDGTSRVESCIDQTELSYFSESSDDWNVSATRFEAPGVR